MPVSDLKDISFDDIEKALDQLESRK